MKLAIFSDIHGNVPALHAVLHDIATWQPDHIICNGDLINRGPNSSLAFDIVTQYSPSIQMVAGNHEDFVLNSRKRAAAPGEPWYEVIRFSYWAAEQMGTERLQQVANWPDTITLNDPNGETVYINHASTISNRHGIRPETTDAELPNLLAPSRLFITSHTHRPLIRTFDDTLIVNTGSAGFPFDRNPLPSYARIEFRNNHWQAEIQRVAYDQQQTEQQFIDTGFLEEAGPLARLIQREFQLCRGLMGPWMHQFHAQVLAKTVTMEQSVDAIIAKYQ